MAESDWTRHALAIGVCEFRRSVRALRRSSLRFAMIAFGASIPLLLGGLMTVAFADAIRGLEALPESGYLRGTVALFWLFGTFLVGQRVVSARTRIEAEPFVLTTVSARTTAAGLVVAETLRILAYFVPTLLLSVGVCVFLLGSPAALLSVPAATLLFAVTVVVAGSACGYAVALLVATSPFVARHRTVLGTVASLGVMGLYFLFFLPEFGPFDQSSLAVVPVGWLVDLALAGTGLTTPWRWLGAALSTAAVLLTGAVAVDRLTSALWFTEPVSVDSSESDDAAGDERSATARRDALAAAVKPLVVPRLLSTPTRRVAEWALLRTRRDPNRLTFLMVPAFAIGGAFANIAIQSDSIGTMAAPFCAVALPWAAGSLFAMNPLGDEGAVLPVTLTAVPGRQFVRGLVVPGLLVGLPFVTLATGLATLISPYSLVERVALIGLSAVLTCVAVAIAPAIGMTFPRFSAISVGRSRDVIPPRSAAVTAHAVLTVGPGAALAALLLVSGIPRVASIAGIGIGVAAGVLVAALSYRYAIGRFERYTTT